MVPSNTVLSVCPLVLATAACAVGDVVDFESDRWVQKDAAIAEHLGRTCLSGTAYLKDVEFQNGVIEVDLAVSGKRSYPGLVFRMKSEEQYERFYVRPHRAGLYPDALQYTPVFNRVAGWQLYHGDGCTAPADIPENEWIHLKMEIHGTQARLFLNDADEPALIIHDLKHGVSKGSIGVMGPTDGTAYFSNFRYRLANDFAFGEPRPIVTPTGTLTEWEISRPFPASQVDRTRYPRFFTIFNAQWQRITSEASGLVDLSRHVKRPGTEPSCVFARTVIYAPKKRDVQLLFGYSDDVTVFLNGKPVFSGISGYRSRDPSFVGAVGLYDTVYLPLQKGLNEIFLMVTEAFGGWGFMAQSTQSLAPPPKRHDLLTRVWETPAVFKVPESVLYDSKRDILYVSSYNKLQRGNHKTGFISRITLDGQIDDLTWVADLDGPCGMGIYGDKLYVAESSGHLAEIDIDAGRIVERYAVTDSGFLNGLVVDQSGTVYISNTSRALGAKDIYRCKDGRCEIWKDGDDLHRTNGLFLHENGLIAGNTGDGLLKCVSLDDGRVSTITSLGAGVIDGIRVDHHGNYLVSHWEGKTYLVSPSGEVTEILDTVSEGRNIADFEFVKDKDLLIIPTFVGNTVVAYRLSQD